MNEKKERILELSREIFLQEGFYKTSLDGIAQQLKISKKTIYKYFRSKDELVRESILNFIQLNQRNASRFISSEHNSVEKLFYMFNYVGKMLVKVSENYMKDIKNYMPDLWEEIDKNRTKILYTNLKFIIEQGQSEGYFVDTQSDILVSTFIVSIRGIMNPDTLISNKLAPAKALDSIVEILLNGILTEKGRKIFRKLKSGESK